MATKRKSNNRDGTKNLGGRPSKLTPELCQRLENLISEWDPFEKKGKSIVKEFFSLAILDSVAFKLDISSRTLYRFQQEESELGERFCQSLKMYETKRNSYFFRILPYFQRDACWIFLAKNFLNFTDVNRLELAGVEGRPIQIEETRRRVLAMKEDELTDVVRRAKIKALEETKSKSH